MEAHHRALRPTVAQGGLGPARSQARALTFPGLRPAYCLSSAYLLDIATSSELESAKLKCCHTLPTVSLLLGLPVTCLGNGGPWGTSKKHEKWQEQHDPWGPCRAGMTKGAEKGSSPHVSEIHHQRGTSPSSVLLKLLCANQSPGDLV